jgi:hypothetical protein
VEGQITDGVYVPPSTPFGKSYVQWTVAWHQWANSLETVHHPLYDTADPCTGQSGPVWFLGGPWANDGVTARSAAIPQGVALFFPIMVALADNTGCPTPSSNTEAQLLSWVGSEMDQFYSATCMIDGAPVPDILSSYRFQTPSFSYTDPPNNNMLEAAEGEPCYHDSSPTPTPWTVTGAVADGYYLMVAPLALGSHTVHFTADSQTLISGVYEDMTYNVTVLNANLGNPQVFPPDSTPFGQTYGQWVAAHWKWLYSLPLDQNPLLGSADLSLGSDDVWFLGGSLITTSSNGVVLGGSTVRNATVPEGKALFFPLIEVESAEAEGRGTNFGQLFASSQFLMDHATNLSCVVDGQPMVNLAHYRAQSPLFSWGPLPSNNAFGDPQNFPAALSSSSVADGYYVMLAPLAAGTHSLRFTGGVALSTVSGDPYNFSASADVTYNLTVTPLPLTIAHQGNNALISWPSSAAAFQLQASPLVSASSPWPVVPQTPTTNGGVVSVVVPATGQQQFFRLVKAP